MPSSHLILYFPLFLLPPIPPSIRVFSNESTLCMRWPKYWSFSLSINPSKEHPRLISFRMDWFYLLAVQGTLKSLLQYHISKASILGHPSAPAPGILYHASNLDLRFVLHMIIYMFQCHSPKPFLPRPLPQSPKDCFLHLCFSCCLT